MLRLVGATQGMGLLRTDRVASSMRCSVRVLALFVCGVAVLLGVGATSARAEAFISHRPTGIKEHELIADNFGGTIESEPEFNEPPGNYYYTVGLGPGGNGTYEYTEECEKGNILEGCEGLHTVIDQNSEGEVPKKFTKLEHLYIETDYRGQRIVTKVRYAWKPTKRRRGVRRREGFGLGNPAEKNVSHPCKGDPVDCATGNEVESQTDISIPALGVPFALERTYNSQAAAEESSPGLFGYGWSSSFSNHLEFNTETGAVTVVQANGSTVVFFGSIGKPGEFAAPSWAQAKLIYTEEGTYKYTLPNQETFTFSSSGQILSESERNGNTTTVTYHEVEVCEGGCHEVHSIQITDPAGRKITLTLNSGGQIESASDPMGHVVHYGYEGGDLMSVTEPGESSPRWHFKYDTSHQLTEMTNGVSGHTSNEYNEAHQVVSQTSPLGQKLHFAYEEIASKEGGDYSFSPVADETPEEEDQEEIEYVEVTEGFYVPPSESKTTITNENTGAVEQEHFNGEGELETVTRAVGTPIATTESFTYNSTGELTKAVNGDSQATEYGYNAAGDKTSEKNADGDETKWTYDSKHDIETETTPGGETTTIKRNSVGDPEVIERPAPGSTTQKTKYKYAVDGEIESVTNPLERTWKYEYDVHGNRRSETDPEGNKRTWEYNEDSQETATVSPRGNVAGAEASKFTTKIERDEQGRPLKITDPLSHTTKYTYDGDGNVETMTDGNSHKTKYTHNAENELTKTEEPNKTVTETEYDGAGQVVKQVDGNKHATKYVRNLLEEVEEVVNPLGKKTLKEYDKAGNLVKLTDPKGRTTSYTYDPANRLTEIVYSSGTPATVKYEYNKDGARTKMTDGTGTTKYEYDQLDRMTQSENGHKEIIKYEYNLGNQQIKITYPNTKAVERAYDKDGRLEKITDWNKKETKFAYNEDSNLKTITFPSETKDIDTYAYNDAGQMTEVKMKKSTETLGSLVYTRDNDGQVKKITSKDLPGAEVTENTYDENNRLTKYGSTEYKYDSANNATTEGSSTNAYNEGDELEKGTDETYSYDELGERTKITPEKGPATTYGYDQAGNLISVERPKEGETPEIKDTYAYNGENLRTSQTIAGTTSYLAWDMAEELPLILSDGTNNYIAGPGGLPIEQISSGGTVSYMHHDQQGSTRLLTSSTGVVTGKCTYGAYGTPTCEGTITSPLGYDAQYTNSDTGLIYLRAREYDPSTAQFMSVDPLVALTGEPYSYVGDNPLTFSDPTGRCGFWCVTGIVAGGIALGTGIGEVAAGGAAIGGVSLGVISAVSGGLGAVADTKECAGGSSIACVGAGVGVVATGGAGAVAFGAVTGATAAGATAIGLTTSGIGSLGDVAGALASPNTPEGSTATGCG